MSKTLVIYDMIENIVWKQDIVQSILNIGSKWVFIFASKNDIDSDINLMKNWYYLLVIDFWDGLKSDKRVE